MTTPQPPDGYIRAFLVIVIKFPCRSPTYLAKSTTCLAISIGTPCRIAECLHPLIFARNQAAFIPPKVAIAVSRLSSEEGGRFEEV